MKKWYHEIIFLILILSLLLLCVDIWTKVEIIFLIISLKISNMLKNILSLIKIVNR